jgi:hypothetical protein
MLPDLRFVMGASLAIAMLAVAGLGLAISTQLLHEARVNPVVETQSLAYAGQAQDNPFYDPGSALRFTRGLGKPDEAAVPLRVPLPPEPNPDASAKPEEPAANPADRIEANLAVDKDPAPPAVEPAVAERPAPSEATKPPEGSAAAAPSPPAEPERVANAPAASPAADVRKEEDSLPAGNATESASPAAAAKPVHHRPRPKFARTPRAGEQGFQYSGFPTGNTQWSSYANTWGTPPGTKKKTGTAARW